MPERNRDKALLYFHGGGLVILGGEPAALFARIEAFANRCKVYAVDYRNPPDHPYPAAIDDCVAVYGELLKRCPSDRIVISGASGGGNLAAAVPLKIRDLGLPPPAAVGLFTPEVDLTESGDTFHTNRDIDVILRGGLPTSTRSMQTAPIWPTRISRRSSPTSPRGSRPPSSRPVPAMYFCPTPPASTARCARPGCRRSCMSGRRCRMAASAARRRIRRCASNSRISWRNTPDGRSLRARRHGEAGIPGSRMLIAALDLQPQDRFRSVLWPKPKSWQ